MSLSTARENMLLKKLLDTKEYKIDVKVDATNCKDILYQDFENFPTLMMDSYKMHELSGLDSKDCETIKQQLTLQSNIDKVFKIVVLSILGITKDQKDRERDLFVKFTREILFLLDDFKLNWLSNKNKTCFEQHKRTLKQKS